MYSRIRGLNFIWKTSYNSFLYVTRSICKQWCVVHHQLLTADFSPFCYPTMAQQNQEDIRHSIVAISKLFSWITRSL